MKMRLLFGITLTTALFLALLFIQSVVHMPSWAMFVGGFVIGVGGMVFGGIIADEMT